MPKMHKANAAQHVIRILGTDLVMNSLDDAMMESLVKHGPVTHDPVRACTTLAEELGEISQSALEMTRPNKPLDAEWVASRDLQLANMRAELCQLAAYAVLCIDQIDRKGFRLI